MINSKKIVEKVNKCEAGYKPAPAEVEKVNKCGAGYKPAPAGIKYIKYKRFSLAGQALTFF